MKFLPSGDRVLVRLLSEEEKTSGGIFIPDSASRGSFKKAEVVAKGDGEKCEKCSLFIAGSIVMVDTLGANEVTDSGEKLLLVRYEDVYGTFVE